MRLGEFIKNLIFWSGMTQKEVADKCHISAPVLNDIVKGKRGINANYARAFEECFGIPSIVFLTYQNYEELKY